MRLILRNYSDFIRHDLSIKSKNEPRVQMSPLSAILICRERDTFAEEIFFAMGIYTEKV